MPPSCLVSVFEEDEKTQSKMTEQYYAFDW